MPLALLGFIVGVCTLFSSYSFSAFIHSFPVWMSALFGLLLCLGFYYFKVSKNKNTQEENQFSYRYFIFGIVCFLISFNLNVILSIGQTIGF